MTKQPIFDKAAFLSFRQLSGANAASETRYVERKVIQSVDPGISGNQGITTLTMSHSIKKTFKTLWSKRVFKKPLFTVFANDFSISYPTLAVRLG